jgi:D-glycero-D-manno-heptose 1,7-bisphosphate phosphatase
MFKEISDRFGLELKGVPAIGDSLRDLQAAAAVGADPILLLTGKGKKTAATSGIPAATKIFPNLAAAVDALTQ